MDAMEVQYSALLAVLSKVLPDDADWAAMKKKLDQRAETTSTSTETGGQGEPTAKGVKAASKPQSPLQRLRAAQHVLSRVEKARADYLTRSTMAAASDEKARLKGEEELQANVVAAQAALDDYRAHQERVKAEWAEVRNVKLAEHDAEVKASQATVAKLEAEVKEAGDQAAVIQVQEEKEMMKDTDMEKPRDDEDATVEEPVEEEIGMGENEVEVMSFVKPREGLDIDPQALPRFTYAADALFHWVQQPAPQHFKLSFGDIGLTPADVLHLVGESVMAEFFVQEATLDDQTALPQRLLSIMLAPLAAIKAQAAAVAATAGAAGAKPPVHRDVPKDFLKLAAKKAISARPRAVTVRRNAPKRG